MYLNYFLAVLGLHCSTGSLSKFIAQAPQCGAFSCCQSTGSEGLPKLWALGL